MSEAKISNCGPPKNNTEENRLMTKMLAYSAKKIKANPTLPYSILNPETSSDSPSAKSKGARFVSATHVTNQRNAAGAIKNANQRIPWPSEISIKLKLPIRKRGKRRINAMLIS